MSPERAISKRKDDRLVKKPIQIHLKETYPNETQLTIS